MVPVVILRSRKDVFQWSEIHPGVGMDQYSMYGNKNDVNIENCCRKSENIQRNKGHGPGEKYVHKMGTATCQPVHAFCRVVDGVETPEVYTGMEKAVCPVLKEICSKESEE
ncbi:hypothetical protein D3C86_1986800 [compost metagenome]